MKLLFHFVGLTLSMALFASCNTSDTRQEETASSQVASDDRKVVFYKSPMDPSFISTKPGKDSMGMDLVPVYEGDPGSDLNTIALDGATIQRMGVRVEKVTRQKLTRIVRAVGRIEFDETRVSKINMKFDGWIEKLWVDETGQYVAKGAPLFSIYSQELFASQEEYLRLIKGQSEGSHATHLIDAARERLLQFDVPQSVLTEIENSGSPVRNVIIPSSMDGYVVHKDAFAGTGVKKGHNLFTIADLNALWVIADVFEADAPWVARGQQATVELDYLPGSIQEAEVDYVYPVLDAKTRTMRIRVVLPNPAVVLKPGMFATVRIHTQPVGESVVVPTDAVIHSGERNIAFASLGEGRFEPRELKLGIKGDEAYQVLGGLTEGEEVVVSSQFLLDSESRLKEAVKKMLGANVTPPTSAKQPTRKDAKAKDHAGQDH